MTLLAFEIVHTELFEMVPSSILIASLLSDKFFLLRQSVCLLVIEHQANIPILLTGGVLPIDILLKNWGRITQGFICFDPRIYSIVSWMKNPGFHFSRYIIAMLITTVIISTINGAPIMCWDLSMLCT